MYNNLRHPDSHLFTLRIWSEPLGNGWSQWRGKVQHVTSGETHYFREWSMLAMLPELNDKEVSAKSG